MVHFWENCKKKVLIEVQVSNLLTFLEIFTKNHVFSGPVTYFQLFLQFSQKCAGINRPFRSLPLLWKCCSNFLVELYLADGTSTGDVLEVLLVVEFKFIFWELNRTKYYTFFGNKEKEDETSYRSFKFFDLET